ncbi:MAG: LysR family transcriptional regulator [Arachnia sp.]
MTWPALIDLELLIRSDQLGSVSAAARELGLTQPEASRRLTRLEASLDLHLLIRSHTGSRLTKSGELVAEWSHQLLDQASQWRAGVTALHAEINANLEVAASQTIAEYLAPLWLARFRREHSDVAVRLEVHNSAHVVHMVREGHVGLGFVETPTLPVGLGVSVVARDRLVVVVPPGHPWVRRDAITLHELAATPLVVREEGSGTRQTLEDAFEGLPRREPALELPSNAAVLSASSSGAGPAVISALAARGAISEGRLRRVKLSEGALKRELRAVWRQDEVLAPAAQMLLHMISIDA